MGSNVCICTSILTTGDSQNSRGAMSGSVRLVARPAETQCNEYGGKVFEPVSLIFRRSVWFFGLTILLLWKARCIHRLG